MQVVLLAAGMGLRLGHLTRALPKALIRLNGKPLIDYTLPRLLANKRVEEVIVVGGFEFGNLERHLDENYSLFGDRLRLVENRRFTLGNLYTMEAALPYLSSSFLICNVDHVFTEKTWSFILQERETPTIFCDFLRALAEDEMKVLLNDDKHVVDMSKTLDTYDAGYVGLTYLSHDKAEMYREALAETAQIRGDKAVVENVLPLLASQGEAIHVVPFDKNIWHEVDTREDLAKAEDALNALEAEENAEYFRQLS
ncbi:MAG: NTP transferase domain-containing protein [Deltaproteobacteria bacterium]|nr:NTP transferase domain-containing protein [Deltaproteobacteria bacterium]